MNLQLFAKTHKAMKNGLEGVFNKSGSM